MSLRLVRCLTLSLLATAALATPALAGWEEELAEQIEHEHDCKVAFLSRIIERTVEGHKVVRAKVHCDDERSFEAFRPEESDRFRFTETTNSDA
jgi:hypothetical protein